MASYCASLTRGQIVDIYQQYLNKMIAHTAILWKEKESSLNAAESIREFLDIPDLDEAK